MAFAASTLWEVQNGGTDTLAGGGWNAASTGTDKTLSAAIQRTDLVIDATTNTKITSAGTPFAASDVGNVIAVTAGTGFTVQRVQIVSVAAAVATCDKAVGTTSSTGGTGYLGGFLATPGQAFGLKVAGNTVWLKYNATPFTTTSGSANVAGGVLTSNVGSSDSTHPFIFQGYDVTRGDHTANRPTFTAGTNGVTLLIINGDASRVDNIIFDQGSATSIDGVNCNGSGVTLFKCKAKTNNTYGFSGTDGTCFINCEADGGSASLGFSMNNGDAVGCIAKNWTGSIGGFRNGRTLNGCIALGCSNDGFNLTAGANGVLWINCIAYNGSTNGFNLTGNGGGIVVMNCIAYLHNGVSASGFAGAGHWVINCAAGNCTTNFSANLVNALGSVTLGADPFTNAAGNDFSLNKTSNGGTLCRGAGWLGVYPPDVSTTGFVDIGVQSQTGNAVTGGILANPGTQGGCNA